MRPRENDRVVHHYSTQFYTVEAFRDHLVQSPEYIVRHRTAFAKSFLARTAPPDIETVMDERTLEQVVAKTASYWSKIGADAPQWSLLYVDKHAPDRLPENLDEFYGSGIGDFYLVRDLLQRMNRSPDDFECILEFGCGVGRATAPLAAAFERVIALDISAPHLELARQHVASAGARNVEFVQVTPGDLMPARGYDLWYSRLVLQHNPPPVTLSILAKAFPDCRPAVSR